mmetsp:Transcript_25526/g.47575  ORF Transcript_25526/g.47575 Transcript_25526/m.47575 type:complete len:88 (+) Transcript_25526:3-266(+)
MKSLAVLLLGGNAFGAGGHQILENLQDDDKSVCTMDEKGNSKKNSKQNNKKLASKGNVFSSGFSGFSGLMGGSGSSKGLKKVQEESS